MRINKPKPFDSNKEYKIGERCIYDGKILVLEEWKKIDVEILIKYKAPIELASRCLMCKIKKDVCTGPHLQCDKFSRSDKKNTYWRFLRIKKN